MESQDSASTTNTSEPSTSDGTSPADTVIQESVQKLLEGSSLLDYNEEYLKKYGQSDLVARSSAAEMLALLSPDEKHRSVKLIMEEGTKIRYHSVHYQTLRPVLCGFRGAPLLKSSL